MKKKELEVRGNAIHCKQDYLDKSFLVFRPNNFAVYQKPILVRAKQICVETGREIVPGQYAYKCLANPTRLSPTGKHYCSINAAMKRGPEILPAGFFALRVPTTEEMRIRGKIAEADRGTALGKQAVKMLAEHKF